MDGNPGRCVADGCDEYRVVLMQNFLSKIASKYGIRQAVVNHDDAGNELTDEPQIDTEADVDAKSLHSLSSLKKGTQFQPSYASVTNFSDAVFVRARLLTVSDSEFSADQELTERLLPKNVDDEEHISTVEHKPSSSADSYHCSLRLYHIKNQRYYLITPDRNVPVVAFSHLPCSRHRITRTISQSEETSKGTIDSVKTIRPISFKKIEEISFENVISSSVSSSKENSPSKRLIDDLGKHIFVNLPKTRTHSLSRKNTDTSTLQKQSSIDSSDYDPNLINTFDPDCSSRKTTLKYRGYVSTLMHYQSPNEAKRLVNEMFRSRYPHVLVSFSKIHSIKNEMRRIAMACNFDHITTAHALVFYEKSLIKFLRVVFTLHRQGLVCKTNRKLVAGAALIVAAKITDFGVTRTARVVNYLETSLRVNRKELLRYEIPLCVALKFDLNIPYWQLLPHYQRILLEID